jgi:hypothetical protein
MTHENHFTPCLYLKRFANPDGGVFSYKTLVPHEHVREWKLTSPKAVGKLEHLYTRNVNGEDKDDIERWFKHEFEDPAVHPVCNGSQFSPA